MSRAAKATLLGSIIFTTFTIWGVHFLQNREADRMYAGVLRDDARREEKLKQREAELQESIRKRELYERFQSVGRKEDGAGS